ncbi:ABC transporter permease [Cellulomonas sp. NS3]|uniref:ABC transporter permease n=1 Tax=Cellulomonas sp. NS3 TaxID=2973977 RepID=UPI0021628130|nr:ABC transporter permease [Cellulomonas sp. NS3]
MTDVHTPPSTTPTSPAPHRPGPGHPGGRHPWALATAVALALTAAVATIFVAFALPAVTSEPHDVPIGIAGPPPAVEQVEQALAAARPGAFDATTYPDADALRAAVLGRDAYGGLVLGPDGATVVVASGASPVVAQLLADAGEALAERSGTPVTTQDVVPLPADDPRGAGLAAAVLPITLGGILPAVALARALPHRPWLRVAAASGYSLMAGLTLTALLDGWFGSTSGAFWPVALGLSLGIAATSLTLLGLERVAGTPGLAAGAALVVLVGNPLSGMASAPELLAPPWGLVGQLLPPGATGSLLRSTAYLDGAGATRPVVVLLAWVACGLLLTAVASVRRHRAPRDPRA